VGRKEVRDLVVRLKNEGKTIFLNSHLLSEIEMVCDQIVILNHGEVARTGTPDEVHSRRRTSDDPHRKKLVLNGGRCCCGCGVGIGDVVWHGAALHFTPAIGHTSIS